MLTLVFSHGITLHIGTGIVASTLNENKVVTDVDRLEEALVKVSCYHRIHRGKILGIRCKGWNNGEMVQTVDIQSLSPEACYFAWDLVQENQDAPVEVLLDIVSSLQTKSALSEGVLSGHISKWKIPFIWSSNALEGGTYTLGETEVAIRHGIAVSDKPDEDFSNAVDGSHAVDFLSTLVTCSGDHILHEDELKHLHHVSFQHSFQSEFKPGQYRDHAIRVTGSSFVFPAPGDVPGLMAPFVGWLNSSARAADHPVAFAVEAHLRFVTIHPFGDGNGRMSRLLMNLVLLKRGYPPICILPTCRPEYMDSVRDYQVTGETNAAKLLALIVNEVMAALAQEGTVQQEAQAAIAQEDQAVLED